MPRTLDTLATIGEPALATQRIWEAMEIAVRSSGRFAFFKTNPRFQSI
jgi:hypothetical protein